jgi:hypothetical protein
MKDLVFVFICLDLVAYFHVGGFFLPKTQFLTIFTQGSKHKTASRSLRENK